ncbi:MAG: hypothetical protein ABIJ08_06120 [Nanoarchaeota archaeon]
MNFTSQDPVGEEIIIPDIGVHNYYCFSCRLDMDKIGRTTYKCQKCGLIYNE